MPLLSPYRHNVSSQRVYHRLLWLSGGTIELWTTLPLGRALAHDRLLYHFSSYLLVSGVLSHIGLGVLVQHCHDYEQLLHQLKALIRQSIRGAQLKALRLEELKAWRVALLHNVAHALEQTNDAVNDLPFEFTSIGNWELRLVHAQPCVSVWGRDEERWLWLEETEATLSQWPADFVEEEHPSNGDLALLGRESQELPYTYVRLSEVLSEVRSILATRMITDASFVALYNRIVRLSGAYAARPLANAALFPPNAAWDTLQQHRLFATRAQRWLQDCDYLPPCTRLLLTKSYTQAERPYFHWSQHDRKRYLEAMQRSIDTLCLS